LPLNVFTQVGRYERKGSIRYSFDYELYKTTSDSCSCENLVHVLYDNRYHDYDSSYLFIDSCISAGLDPNCVLNVRSVRQHTNWLGFDREKTIKNWKATPFQLAVAFGDTSIVQRLLPYQSNLDQKIECCFDENGERISNSNRPILDVSLDNKWSTPYKNLNEGEYFKIYQERYGNDMSSFFWENDRKNYKNIVKCRTDSSVYKMLQGKGVWSQKKKQKASRNMVRYMEKYRKDTNYLDSIQFLIKTIGQRELLDKQYLFKKSLEFNIPIVQKFMIENQQFETETGYTFTSTTGGHRRGLFRSPYSTSYDTIQWDHFITYYPEYPLVETVEYFFELQVIDLEDIKWIANNKHPLFGYKRRWNKEHFQNGGAKFQNYFKKYLKIQELKEDSFQRKLIEKRMKRWKDQLREMNA